MNFIVATNEDATAAERNAITAFLKERNWEVWHWFQDLWIVATPTAEELKKIRREVKQAVPSLGNCLFISLPENIYVSGSVPDKAVPWFHQTFKKPEK